MKTFHHPKRDEGDEDLVPGVTKKRERRVQNDFRKMIQNLDLENLDSDDYEDDQSN